MVALMIATWGVSRKRGYAPVHDRFPTGAEVWRDFKASFWAVLFPVWLLVGIRFGFFTPSEAGAFAVLYALIIGFFIYGELTLATLFNALTQSLRDIGMIMLIILFSGTFGYVITFERVPQSIAEFSLTAITDPTVLLFVISGFLLVLGMLVEATVLVMLLTPILRARHHGGRHRPGAFRAGDDDARDVRRHDAAGGRVSMFTVCGILNCSYKDYTVQMIPLAVAVLSLVTVLILFPQIVLFLPNALM